MGEHNFEAVIYTKWPESIDSYWRFILAERTQVDVEAVCRAVLREVEG
jgi:hypothetical protein